MDKAETGRLGEDIVCRYLESRGCRIVKRNYRIRGGEIDIIAEDDSHIIFTEVKTRRVDSMVSGLEAITKSKQRLVIRAAERYLSDNKPDLQPRFDAAEVTVSDGRAVKLKYLKNAYIKE